MGQRCGPLHGFSGEHIPVARLKGHEVCVEYFEEQGGFTTPILVDRTDGLDLKLPPANFTIQDVENHVGQWACLVTMGKWHVA